jgi:hypothetical protein
LIVNGAIIAQGVNSPDFVAVRLPRDSRDDNASKLNTMSNPHPPTAGESLSLDPSIFWLFAREVGGNKSLLGEEVKSYKEEQP